MNNAEQKWILKSISNTHISDHRKHPQGFKEHIWQQYPVITKYGNKTKFAQTSETRKGDILIGKGNGSSPSGKAVMCLLSNPNRFYNTSHP